MTTTAQTFEEYCALHLPQRIMEAGLGVRPEENYMDVPPEPERDVTVYMVGTWDSSMNFGFYDLETATSLLELKAIALNDGKNGVESANLQIFPKQVFSSVESREHADVLARREKALAFNEPIRKEVEAYDKAMLGVRDKLYSEWCEELETRRTEQRIRDTYADYLKTAQDNAAIAFEFLVKTFPNHDTDELRRIVG